MKTYFGYPQHPDSHPERPWWRYDVVARAFERTDDEVLTWNLPQSMTPEIAEPHLAARDRWKPLPRPRLLCGQVWVWTDSAGFRRDQLIVNLTAGINRGETPPPHAVLVDGPLSPWAPQGDGGVRVGPLPQDRARLPMSAEERRRQRHEKSVRLWAKDMENWYSDTPNPKDGTELAYRVGVGGELGLSVRAWNILENNGLNTLGEIKALSLQDLLRLKNVGPRTAAEIDATVRHFGHRLAGGDGGAL